MKKTITILFLLACIQCVAQDANILKTNKSDDEKWGYVNASGEWVIQPKYEQVSSFPDGQNLAYVRNRGKWGYIDRSGNVIVPFIYEAAFEFSDGMAAVKLDGKFGFINETGDNVINFVYDEASRFGAGLAPVTKGKRWGYINKSGKIIIPLQYDYAFWFNDNYNWDNIAIVKQNNKWNYIDLCGDPVLETWCNTYNDLTEQEENVKTIISGREAAIIKKLVEKEAGFQRFAKLYVESEVRKWRTKGEFESTPNWKKRVNERTQAQKIKEYSKKAEQQYILENSKNMDFSTLQLHPYDADNGVFMVVSKRFGNMLVPVPQKDAQFFKTYWNQIKRTKAEYFIENDNLGLASLSFELPDGKSYKYSNQAMLTYSTPTINIDIPIEFDIEEPLASSGGGKQTIKKETVTISKSDIDRNIPTTSIVNDKTFAIIIANENYSSEARVPYAINDGKIFKEYCNKTLGLPNDNIVYRENATLNQIRGAIRIISNISKAYNGDINVIFYYAGHGIPDESNRESYLLPVDGYGSDVMTGYSLTSLYQTFGEMNVKSVTVLLDACFSGAKREGDMLASARAVAVRAKQGVPVGNMLILSASSNDETAHQYNEMQHGMFTYFLLKKMQETRGNFTMGDLSSYVIENVMQKSAVVNKKPQTPTATGSATVGESWRSWSWK